MRLIRVNAHVPEHSAIGEAAAALRAGGLVVFPTETVYGLGANALDAAAVERIYAAKGRPPINPIIVHVGSVADARNLASEWTEAAERLARTYWPGPLTLVVRKTTSIPDIVTAGGDTVGVRVPGHRVALALISEAGCPVAAPSANRSNLVSPTTAQHAARDLNGSVDVILDAGPTSVGIESTVVDVTGPVPRVLRPGMITLAAVARAAGKAEAGVPEPGDELRSPGLLARHYAPRARVLLADASSRKATLEQAESARAGGQRVGAMLIEPWRAQFDEEIIMPSDPDGYARELYASLHRLDDAGCELVVVEMPPEGPEWAGILDRLRRAAAAH